MNTWAGRLKLKMKDLGLTQEELARKLGVTRSAVAHYVQGTRHPPLKQMVKLAAVLNVDPAWLQFGKAQEASFTSKQRSKKSANRIPVLDWNQALTYNPDESYDKKLEYFNYNNVECYALQIKGDSMVSPLAQSISFNPGSYVIVDPNKIAAHGSYVIATTSNKKEAILRQYVEEGGVIYLKPLNSQYPLVQLERSTKILGVVITHIQYT
jgi:SOS-response transcriptional repressor LexA